MHMELEKSVESVIGFMLTMLPDNISFVIFRKFSEGK